ncbi:MAG: dihydropteroate synthase [Pseudomonadota bacterium]
MAVAQALTAPRAAICGLPMDRPQIMGILNVTPDSFSDGGRLTNVDRAVDAAAQMVADGAAILDIGGESTRPGATYVEVEHEIERTAPVIEAIRARFATPISIDTRKAPVARAALQAGASLINDVSAMAYDPDMAQVAATAGVPICLMHAQGTPETMQDNPTYTDVVLEVVQHLSDRVAAARAAGIAEANIIVDPGIGFGKTLDHNLALLSHLSVLHMLGVPVLVGASRKRFIGTLTRVEAADERVHGSVAVALSAVAQGAQILRVHDVAATAQAVTMWQAVNAG